MRIDRYDIRQRLGGGDVYLGHDPGRDRLVAIRLLREDYSDEAELRAGFLRQARVLARLNHPNIASVFEAGEHEGRPFLAMEYVDGVTLTHFLRQTPTPPLDRRLELMEALCAGLAHAHAKGVIHREINPSNVMIDRHGVLKILDFGMTGLRAFSKTVLGAILGTISYMSPEQIRGRELDRRSDVFSVGAVLYESIALEQAFTGSNLAVVAQKVAAGRFIPLAEHVPGVDPNLAAIVHRALAIEPNDRYSSAEDLGRDIAFVRRWMSEYGKEDEAALPPVTTGITGESTPALLGRRTLPIDDQHAERRRIQVEDLLTRAEYWLAVGNVKEALHIAEHAAVIDPLNVASVKFIDRARELLEEHSRQHSVPHPASGYWVGARGPRKEQRASTPAQYVQCEVLAEMEPEVVLGHIATIGVSIARESLAALAGKASAASGPISIDAGDALIVQVMPRTNFALAEPSQDRARIAPPEPGRPVYLYFDVKGAHMGPGEIWIIVRQHQMGVARLVLTPAVVDRASTSQCDALSARASAVAAPPLANPINQVSIFEQTVGETVKYVFELELPSLNVFGLYESPPLKGRRDEFVSALYKDIETRYISTRDAASKAADVAAFTAELQAYGAVLFEQLFPREVQELLWTHRETINSIRVVSTEPFIPWEIVHLREPGRPLDADAPTRFLGQMGLVRWLHNVNGLPPVTLRVREGRARYVIPNYPDVAWQLPSTTPERLYLEKTFAATPLEPQPNPVRAALSEPGSFDLLHFACHGEADTSAIMQSQLVLEGRMENGFVPTYLTPATVETFGRLKGADGLQAIVFLNACQAGRAGYQLTGIGGFAQAFLRAGAGAFVGTLWSVGDYPALSSVERSTTPYATAPPLPKPRSSRAKLPDVTTRRGSRMSCTGIPTRHWRGCDWARKRQAGMV